MRLQKLFIPLLALGLIATAMSAADAETFLVCSKATNQVLEYDLATGNYLGIFAEANPSVTYTVTVDGVDETRTVMNEPTGIKVGPDGNVYVAFRDELGVLDAGAIARYTPGGDYLGIFSTAVGTIMNFDFGPNGDIYAHTHDGNDGYLIYGPNSTEGMPGEVAQLLGKTLLGIEPNPDTPGTYYFGSSSTGRVFLNSITNTGAGGNLVSYDRLGTENQINDLEIGPDGKLYALGSTSTTLSNVYVCDLTVDDPQFTLFAAATAASPALNLALGIEFDGNGNVLVCNSREDTVAKFSMADGSFQGNLVDNDGHLDQPYYGICVLPETVAVPEPTMMTLLICSLLGLLVWRRRK